MYFQYGEAETAYLSARDERMAAVIAQVGHIEREMLFRLTQDRLCGRDVLT